MRERCLGKNVSAGLARFLNPSHLFTLAARELLQAALLRRMAELPRISIVTPSFRQLNWLKLCAASVADQQGVSYEHIIQDAGTGPELQQWADGRENVFLYVEQDQGMYDAVNRGLRRARGEICCYLNCDEQYLPGTPARVIAFFDGHPNVDVLFGDAILIDRDGNPLSYRRTILPTLAHLRYAHLNTPTCATFFRRRLLHRGFFFDPEWKAIGDQVWVEQLLLAKVPMATLNESLTVFTFTGQNLGNPVVTEQEQSKHRGALSLANRGRKLIAQLLHRFRKFVAGAYNTREVKIEVFTLDSPERRQLKEGRVGFSWPKQ